MLQVTRQRASRESFRTSLCLKAATTVLSEAGQQTDWCGWNPIVCTPLISPLLSTGSPSSQLTFHNSSPMENFLLEGRMQLLGEVAVETLLWSELWFHTCHRPGIAYSAYGCIEWWGLLPAIGFISPLATALLFVVMEMPDFKAGRILLRSYSPFNSDPNFQLPGWS